ncbi:MAG: molybdopterin-guanine dinucleotide biosynthesis protein B [Methylomonas sp.]|nr:molybdopterin-guanine dinucleotide biosynthesis protein B [Methylomonas sp.]PPD21329.1 MAG: molybdopterin-guanine dinucleotide biosynthesis protein B [Methylomonas sp.]PPD26928.1 MAG: molybdopterin-guanine dinucleotide biosynthesis protein B [Methylomonas sp.]PPD38859.1 MAG: molybdopterin-guanine dinucleotide biosynthesis protein B [Methylomonas sp.]PPD41707.1 MAG: molybdopterin-guanine dinucleotide biosynthesis protein B [Methylomonas sp.]
MPATNPPLILGFAAYSGTGKTTLLAKIIPLLRDQGLHVGVIKHSHHDVDIDHPGKDSHRLRMAGATPVMLVSPYRRVVISERPEACDPDFFRELAHFPLEGLDLVLVEGFRQAAIRKIELHRPSLGKPPLYPNDPNIIAIASDTMLETPAHLCKLDLNQPGAIVEFIISLVNAP